MKHIRLKKVNGSMTVEMSLLMPIILFLILSCILTVFYFHDKNIIAAAAYETSVVGSTKMREAEGVDEGELTALFAERIEGKCILFAGSSVNISVGEKQILVEAATEKGKFRVSVRKRASVTEPEAYIRKKRKLREVINGAANYS